MSTLTPQLSSAELAARFTDIAPGLSPREAVLEANRCLFCYDAPCIKACPTHIDVPGFIRQIGTADTIGAARTILVANIFGGSCARVCPTAVLCEGACVYNGMNGKPIQIGRLQRFATDAATAAGRRFVERGPATGRRVAVVGAGPAGLSCAHELVHRGHACTVFEASSRPGGLNTWGVAGYKIDTEFATAEAVWVAGIGVEVKLNTPVGENPSVPDLLRDYDAVFLAVGLGATKKLGIPGEDLEGCLEALEFIRPTRELGYAGAQIGRHVVVIGGGNTAIDAATAAVRLGAATVTIVYRRTAAEMPAYRFEYELAQQDGVRFEWLAQPKAILGRDGFVAGLTCARLMLPPDGDGRGSPREIPGSEFTLPCDMVVYALGQSPLTPFLERIPGLRLRDGFVVTDPESLATSLPGLYSGGDCTEVAEVVYAVAHGKRAAVSIDTFLSRK